MIITKTFIKTIARCQTLYQGFPFPQLSTNLRPQPLPIYSQVEKLFTTTTHFKVVIAESRTHVPRRLNIWQQLRDKESDIVWNLGFKICSVPLFITLRKEYSTLRRAHGNPHNQDHVPLVAPCHILGTLPPSPTSRPPPPSTPPLLSTPPPTPPHQHHQSCHPEDQVAGEVDLARAVKMQEPIQTLSG